MRSHILLFPIQEGKEIDGNTQKNGGEGEKTSICDALNEQSVGPNEAVLALLDKARTEH